MLPNRRTFTPTPWDSLSWRRGYARSGVLERTNVRLDNSFGFERHIVRGWTRMEVRMGQALALGRSERMHTLVDPGLPAAV